MHEKYSVEPRRDMTVVRFREMPTMRDLLAAMDAAAAVDRSGRRLWVLGKGIDLSTAELRRIADYGAGLWKEPSKSAVVAPQDLAFGLARVHEAYRNRGRHQNQVFRDEGEAVAWLREPFEERD